MSTATPTFSAQILGQTEKALNAILDRELVGTGLTERLWVPLTVTAASGGTLDRDQLVQRLTDGVKVSEAEAQARIAELAAAELLEAPDGEGKPVTLTEAGRQLHGQIRAFVTEVTERMWGDLPPEELTTAARVLSIILERADAELAAA
jgi:hypothetical protein